MDNTGNVLTERLAQSGFPNLAKRWKPFIKDGCTIYVLSDGSHHQRDAYALFWLGRYLYPLVTDVDEVDLVPVYDRLEQTSSKNLVVVGRLRSFKSEELMRTMGKTVQDAHFRFIDNTRLLQVETGEDYVRIEEDNKWIRDYGVLRLWEDNNRAIIHCSGLGSMGTLGTSLAITDFSRPVMKKVESYISSVKGGKKHSSMEILVKSEWRPTDDRFVIRLTDLDVTVEVETAFDLGAKPIWPLIHFQQVPDGKGVDPQYEIWVSDGKTDDRKLLSQNQIECAVFAAIAKHTRAEPSLSVSQGGYVSYEQISQSKIIKEILKDAVLDIPTVRASVHKIRQILALPEWQRAYPNLLLESKVKSPNSNRQITVLRLRAAFKWWDREYIMELPLGY